MGRIKTLFKGMKRQKRTFPPASDVSEATTADVGADQAHSQVSTKISNSSPWYTTIDSITDSNYRLGKDSVSFHYIRKGRKGERGRVSLSKSLNMERGTSRTVCLELLILLDSLVAVHGLSGDWEATWTDASSGKLWLRDFIPSDFTRPGIRLRIWSFGYDSATVLSNSVTDIDDAAIALVDALHGERQTETLRRTPIIFIAHSLGGIVVKRVCFPVLYQPENLCESWAKISHLKAMTLARERSDYWNHIVDNVFGIMFFAVPHRGSDVAYWAAIASRIYTLTTLGLAGNSNFIKSLQRNALHFQQISQSFIQPASKLKVIRTFYETVKIGNQLVSPPHLRSQVLVKNGGQS